MNNNSNVPPATLNPPTSLICNQCSDATIFTTSDLALKCYCNRMHLLSFDNKNAALVMLTCSSMTAR